MSIQVLQDSVVNKIAAGEVVERPASVVRELFDNALDAEADDISIYIEAGGRSSIRVVDNGCGMTRDDALLSLERHATSKIQSAEDLLTISSYGFRGEALSSIAAVSRLTLKTRRKDEVNGWKVEMHGGVLKNVEETSMPVGTDLSVRNLFYNTPARKKFLRTVQTERNKIKLWLQQACLVHPSIRVRLIEDGKDILNFPRRDDFISRAKERYHGAYVPLSVDNNGFSLHGLLGHPSLARTDSAAFVLFVNKRLIRDRLVTKAVREGFQSTLKDKEYPIGCLSLEIDPAAVDVNVHPQKSEVRFHDPKSLYAFIRDGVAEAVSSFTRPVQGSWRPEKREQSESGHCRAPMIPGEYQTSFSERLEAGSRAHEVGVVMQTESSVPAEPHDVLVAESVVSEGPGDHAASFSYRNLKFVGQAMSCFLFFEDDQGLCVVDMHAAHERVTYNRLSRQIKENPLDSQLLLVPLTLTLLDYEKERLERYEETLLRYGITIESFGTDTIVVRSVPSLLAKTDIKSLLVELAALPLEEMAQDRIEESLNHRIARLACHASVRSGQHLSEKEAYALLEAMDQERFAGACPHGRPAVVRYGRHDIEKWFGRDR